MLPRSQQKELSSMTIAPDILAALAGFDPVLAALAVALAAIGLGCVALWAAVRLGARGDEK